MIPFRKSIGFRLLGISVILLAFPLLVDSFILVQKRYRHTIADAKGYLVEVARLREIPMEQLQPLHKPLLEVMTYYLSLQSDFPNKPSPELEEKLSKMATIGNFSGIFLIKFMEDNRYVVTASSLPSFVGKDYTNFFRLFDFFETNVAEEGYASFITYNSKTLEPYLIVAHLVFSMKAEKAVGVLAVSDDITFKLEELLHPDKDHYPVSFALLLPSTVVFAASDPNLRFQYFLPLKEDYRRLFIEEEPVAAKFLADKPLEVNNKIGYPFFEFTWKGIDQIGYIRKIPHTNFALLTYASRGDIFRAPVAGFFNLYSVYGLILIIGGTIATVLTMRMAKPIQNLSSVMQEIQKGNLSLRYEKDPLGFEINVLGNIFNEMIDALLEQKKVAEEERVKRETLARELRLGQQVQLSLLPQKMPQYPGVDVAEKYIPAIEVGGDYYDVFVKKQKAASPKLVLAVADASGKGVQACFYSLSVRNIFRTYAKSHEDIGMAVSATNNLFRLDAAETGMFVTAFVGMYDYESKIFHYFSAGHNPAIVRRKDGKIEVLKRHGIAMGVIATGEQKGESIQLNQGDAVIFYTDGITEAHDMEFRLFGEKKLIQIIEKEGWRGSSELVEHILQQLNQFVGKAPQHDDITLLIMKII